MTFNELALLIPCDKCEAEPGSWCWTRSGLRARYFHNARTWPVQQVWVDGYHEGQEDAIYAVDSNSPWGLRYVEQIRERRAS